MVGAGSWDGRRAGPRALAVPEEAMVRVAGGELFEAVPADERDVRVDFDGIDVLVGDSRLSLDDWRDNQ